MGFCHKHKTSHNKEEKEDSREVQTYQFIFKRIHTLSRYNDMAWLSLPDYHFKDFTPTLVGNMISIETVLQLGCDNSSPNAWFRWALTHQGKTTYLINKLENSYKNITTAGFGFEGPSHGESMSTISDKIYYTTTSSEKHTGNDGD